MLQLRVNVTSRKLIICLLASMVMRSPLLLKVRHISFLMLSVSIRTSTRSKCVIHYLCMHDSTHAQISVNTTDGDLDLASIIATKCGFCTESIDKKPVLNR